MSDHPPVEVGAAAPAYRDRTPIIVPRSLVAGNLQAVDPTRKSPSRFFPARPGTARGATALIQFRCVDPKEPNTFRADHERIAINHACRSRNTARTVHLGHRSLGAITPLPHQPSGGFRHPRPTSGGPVDDIGRWPFDVLLNRVENAIGSSCHLLHGRADAIHQRVHQVLCGTHRVQEVRARHRGKPSDQNEQEQERGKNSLHGPGRRQRPGAGAVLPPRFRWECRNC